VSTSTRAKDETMTTTLPLTGGTLGQPTGHSLNGTPPDVLGDDLPPAGNSRLGRLWRGKPTDPSWVRPSLFLLLAATALLYLWDLGASGWANTFYSAAVQAGTKSWEAFFYGSSDASNFITVDKPPASLWVMELSARIFGLNAWSVLAPQALEGVAAVGLLYVTVRRWFTPGAALLAGSVLALTPVATLMFKFNNPDALLVLLLVGGAYAMTRAVEKASTRWLVLAATLVGFGFITKMMQAFLVVPVFALMYLVAAPTPLRRRLWQLVLAGVALVVASGWWVAIVELVPTADRPYIGGSQDNSVLSLIFGYNGFGRLTGNETGSVVGGGATGTSGMWGATGFGRLFSADMGGQISWLIPAALLSFAALMWVSRRAPRTDRLRAATILWGGWLIVTGLTFSFAEGIIHPYYTVALAPAIAALVGIAAATLWGSRNELFSRVMLAVGVAGTAVWAYVLLERSADWYPWLRYGVLAGGLAVAGVLLVGHHLTRRLALATAAAGIIVALAAPTAYSLQTATTAHSGSIPSAGPTVSGSGGFGGRGGGPGGAGAFGGGTRPTGTQGGFGGGAPPTGTQGGPGGAGTAGGTAGGAPQGTTGAGGAGGGAGGAGGVTGGAGGLLNGSTASEALVTALQANASNYTWAAAAVGANSAAGYQLASGEPVMSIGGFNGTDPAPSLAQFQAYVAAGKIHYFIAGGGGMGGGGGGQSSSSSSSAITSWVEANYAATTIGGTTVYDLTAPTSSSSTSPSSTTTT
jgi:4-amino-4-deoxy-L-arabinose transferase-like glycosyltransferase